MCLNLRFKLHRPKVHDQLFLAEQTLYLIFILFYITVVFGHPWACVRNVFSCTYAGSYWLKPLLAKGGETERSIPLLPVKPSTRELIQ